MLHSESIDLDDSAREDNLLTLAALELVEYLFVLVASHEILEGFIDVLEACTWIGVHIFLNYALMKQK